MSVVADLQSYLATVGLVDGSTGWTSVRRVMHDEADRIVALTEDGGLPAELPAAAGIGEGAWGDLGVQVSVRAEQFNSDASYAKAKEILDQLHGLTDANIGSGHYHRVSALTTEPVYLGLDETSRPEHSVSFRLLATVPTP